MLQKQRKISDTGLMIAGLVFMNGIILNAAFTEDEQYFWGLLMSLPLLFATLWARALK